MYVTFLSVLFCCFLLLSLYSHVFFFSSFFSSSTFGARLTCATQISFPPLLAYPLFTLHFCTTFFLTYHTIASAFTSFFL